MKNQTAEPVEVAAIDRTGQAALLHNFAEAIRSGTPAETSGEDTLWSFAAVIAGIRSAQERRGVEVQEILE